jgi:hypothetical protein
MSAVSPTASRGGGTTMAVLSRSSTLKTAFKPARSCYLAANTMRRNVTGREERKMGSGSICWEASEPSRK